MRDLVIEKYSDLINISVEPLRRVSEKWADDHIEKRVNEMTKLTDKELLDEFVTSLILSSP